VDNFVDEIAHAAWNTEKCSILVNLAIFAPIYISTDITMSYRFFIDRKSSNHAFVQTFVYRSITTVHNHFGAEIEHAECQALF
jgi:hypothetical protein